MRWHQKLKGLGLGLVSMATSAKDAEKRGEYVTIAESMRQAAAHAAHAG
jgi:hypothetical protein